MKELPMLRWLLIVLFVFLLSACGGANDAQFPTQASLPGQVPDLETVPIQLLDFWSPVTRPLDSADEIHGWRFIGQQGDAIHLRVIGHDITVTMLLVTEDGALLAQGDNIQTTLPADGRYTVLVQQEQPGSGSYELGLSYTDRPNPGESTPTPLPQVVGVPTPTPPYASLGSFISRITAGETIGGVLTEDMPVHVYSFDGETGQIISVQMTGVSGQVDPVLTLYSPDGAPLAADDDSGGGRVALLRHIHLPENGIYSIQAAGDGVPGSYSLNVILNTEADLATPTPAPTSTPPSPAQLTPTFGPAVSGNRLEDHVPVVGALNRPGDIVRFPILGAAGEVISVGVSPYSESELRPKIEIYDPNSELVATATSTSSNAGGAAVISGLQLPVEGAYVAFVTGENNSVGEYLISYGRGATWQNVMRGEPRLNLLNGGEITLPGMRDVWGVYLHQGDIVSAAVSPLVAGLDPLLEITTARGDLLASDDNSGGGVHALIGEATIPETGIYHLLVRDVWGAGVGTYTLVWRYINSAPTETPVPASIPVLTVDDVAEQGEYLFYSFQGRAGQTVQIRVIAAPDSEFDPVAVLLAPDGTVLVENDDSNGSLNPHIVVDLPEDGTYNVRVNGYLTGGAFEVIVEVLY